MDAVFGNIPRFPQRLGRGDFWRAAYPMMYVSRQMDIRIKELFKRGLVKGTVILIGGNEACSVGMAMPFRPGKDPVALLHRNLAAHLVLGCSPKSVVCQYLANAQSPSHGKEGNVHFGDAPSRRFPMLSHLGGMLAVDVGAVWSARRAGEDVFGLTVIGDGGSSTGQFHESLNMASVYKVPVVFIVENNGYAFSTPVKDQYSCERLSDRAAGYGIRGRTVNGLDAFEVYDAVSESLELMAGEPRPVLIECMTVRLEGHAVYDNAEYVPDEVKAANLKKDPMIFARAAIMEHCGIDDAALSLIEAKLLAELDGAIRESMDVPRPSPSSTSMEVFAPVKYPKIKPYSAKNVWNTRAVNTALDHILADNGDAFVCGQDVGKYGSAFKTCKGLIDKYGGERIVDTPICEAATVGFCLGASQSGSRPIMEFQFADFSTEAVSQLGMNAGTWFFRAGQPAPLLFRLPNGGGITLGAFHSGEFEGLWSRFPGLKLFYPATPQEVYEALMAGFYDPNPCVVFEHKLLYGGKGDIDFDGDLGKVCRPRKYTEGGDVTIVATGAMVEQAVLAVNNNEKKYSAEVWNPFILNPLSFGPVLDSVRRTGRLLVVQESGSVAGLGGHFISLAVRECFGELKCAPALVAAPDTPVPFAKELETAFLPDAAAIGRAMEKMIGDI
ncbi:MAG: thiamine pyrophosphate-dependent enzyme [Chitinispirillia bacterium]|nr:thiamine pyrophosphate-dependent enzyme [Chitinispirillia bacterium]